MGLDDPFGTKFSERLRVATERLQAETYSASVSAAQGFAIKTFLNLSKIIKNKFCMKFRIDNKLATFQTYFSMKKLEKRDMY